jgi:hypothetical protein
LLDAEGKLHMIAALLSSVAAMRRSVEMKSISCMSVVLMLLVSALALASAGADMQALKSDYEKARDKIVGESAGKLTDLTDGYVKSLQKLQDTLNKNGDAKSASVVAGEIERVQKERRLFQDASESTIVILNGVERAHEQEIARLKADLARVAKETAKPQSSADEKKVAKVAAAAPAPVSGSSKIQHAAVGAEVTVSSTHSGETGEGSAAALIDGDLFTRWSSEYSAPQEIIVKLGKQVNLSKLRLHWEKASATKYCVYVSSDGKEWTSIYLYMNTGSGEPESRVDDIDMKNAKASLIKLDLQSCINKDWGFSLYEIEVISSEMTGKGK